MWEQGGPPLRGRRQPAPGQPSPAETAGSAMTGEIEVRQRKDCLTAGIINEFAKKAAAASPEDCAGLI